MRANVAPDSMRIETRSDARCGRFGVLLSSSQRLPVRPLRYLPGRTIFSLLLLVSVASCGGGTTGTSATDSVKFAGYAQTANGERASGLSMSVQSATTNQTLVNSGTDDSGDFSMTLPSDEDAFVVDVKGVGTTTISRKQRGAGTMASTLAVTNSGALVATDFFEAQIDASSLCASLTANGDELIVSGDVGTGPCPVTFTIASQQLSLNSFRADVEGVCDGTRQLVTSARSSSAGTVTVDLNEAFARGCGDVQVSISSVKAVGLTSIFSVE
jgi:hypothetical protein